MNMHVNFDQDVKSQKIQHRRNAISSELLLRALRKHHGDEQQVDIEPEPEVVAEPEPVVEVVAEKPMSPFWFWPDMTPPESVLSSAERVIKYVCKGFNVKKAELVSERRHARIARPRQVAAYLCKTATNTSLAEIGRRLGNRDHSTIHHAARRIAELLPLDPDLAFDVAHIEAKLAEVEP